jgi:cytochrome b6-f complex iron-sulfur subunit
MKPAAATPTPEAGRRKLIRFLLGSGFGASIVSFLYPALKFMMPPAIAESAVNQVSAGKATELKPNSAKLFRFGNRPALLVRTASGEFRAFSATCTHLNCTVQYNDQSRQIWCACHNGLFDLNGKVVGGPPPKPLEQFTAHVQGDEVIVIRG